MAMDSRTGCRCDRSWQPIVNQPFYEGSDDGRDTTAGSMSLTFCTIVARNYLPLAYVTVSFPSKGWSTSLVWRSSLRATTMMWAGDTVC
jgi:hypothetical protein